MAMGTLQLDDRAPAFNLPSVDGRTYSLETFADKPVLVVIFSCNHCPYVQAYEDRMVATQRDYRDRGVQFVAINSNDDRNYPEDSFERMVRSEERRVGKECRTRGAAHHYKKREARNGQANGRM